jgi:hypothetical protein
MESFLGCIYIHKSIAPLAMNLAFLAQKSCFDFVLLGDFFKNPPNITGIYLGRLQSTSSSHRVFVLPFLRIPS